MDIIIRFSAYILWAMMLAGFLYSMKTFPTPFGDSLTAAQKQLSKASSAIRGNYYFWAFFLSFVVIFVLMERNNNSVQPA